jgi:hypothetical protein
VSGGIIYFKAFKNNAYHFLPENKIEARGYRPAQTRTGNNTSAALSLLQGPNARISKGPARKEQQYIVY